MKVIQKIENMQLWGHSACALGAFLFLGRAKAALDASYAASQHPVDFFTGQTGFSGQLLKEYYAHMEAAGTLGTYVKTQLIDFGFILGVALCGLFIGTFIARLAHKGSFAQKLGIAAALTVMLGAGFDAAENMVSFVMLANSDSFANWIALPYSGLAVAKFAMLTFGMGLAALSLAANAMNRLVFSSKQQAA